MEPKNRIAQARKDAGLTARELAAKLGVDAVTVSNWESGRRQLSLERLLQLAELLGVGVAYLLGLEEPAPHTAPVEISSLPALHRLPVWTEQNGWALVNAVKRQLVFTDGGTVRFEDTQGPIYRAPPLYALSLRGVGAPLDLDAILLSERIWVEPITADPKLAAELRGWYRPRDRRLVENEFGNRFYLDSYGVKWLAFESCLSDED